MCLVELLPEQHNIMEFGVDLLLYHALICVRLQYKLLCQCFIDIATIYEDFLCL